MALLCLLLEQTAIFFLLLIFVKGTFVQREVLFVQSCRSVVSGSLGFAVSSHDGWRRRAGSHDSRDVISPPKAAGRVFKHRSSRGRRRGARQFLNKQTSGTTVHPSGGGGD